MANSLTLKLEQFVRLSAEDVAALDVLVGHQPRTLAARKDIISEGERPRTVKLILEGWACRYKMLEDGRRQIIAFFLPGDLCDLNVFILRAMDHSIGTLTPVRYVEITPEAFTEAGIGRPRIVQALLWETLITAAIQREWTVSLGQRTAFERLAHLFCELFYRLRAVGLTERERCELPLTQADLAEATGITPVHVNRTLQELRARDLIRWKGRQFEVSDLNALRDAGLFNPNYLHLDHEGGRLDANDRLQQVRGVSRRNG